MVYGGVRGGVWGEGCKSLLSLNPYTKIWYMVGCGEGFGERAVNHCYHSTLIQRYGIWWGAGRGLGREL